MRDRAEGGVVRGVSIEVAIVVEETVIEDKRAANAGHSAREALDEDADAAE